MNKRMLTLEQLVQFCSKNNLSTFSSKDSGYTLAVQVPAEFSVNTSNTKDMLMARVKVCHTELNRNGSHITEENMTKAMPSLKYRPFLAAFTKDDNGLDDFDSHNIDIVENEDGELEYEYIEQQIGCFTATEPILEYDKDKDKTYVIAEVAIPENYTKAADIIRRKNGTKVSCELSIESMSYNADKKYLELEDFYFTGCTALGEHVEEGMLGSRLDIEDFSSNNSSFSHIENNTEIMTLLSSINSKLDKLDNLNKESYGKEENPVNHLSELLNSYGKTLEDIEFEYEGLTDEELDAAFAEAFDNVEEETVETEEETSSEEDTTEGEAAVKVTESEVETESEDEPEEGESEESDNVIVQESYEPITLSYEISHEDTRYALYQLIQSTYDDDWYGIEKVFDDHFIMYGWDNDNYYGQKYTKNGDCVELDGERYALYAEFVTETEMAELNSMRANYASIVEKLADYEKNELLAKDDWNGIRKTDEFEALKKDHSAYATTDALETRLNEIVLSYAKSGNLNFALNEEKSKKAVTLGARLPIDNKTKTRGKYGNLFAKSE